VSGVLIVATRDAVNVTWTYHPDDGLQSCCW